MNNTVLEPYRRIIGVEWWRKKVLIVPISWIFSGFMKRIREKDSKFGWYFRKVGTVCFGAPGHSWSFVVQHLTFSTHKSRKFAFFLLQYILQIIWQFCTNFLHSRQVYVYICPKNRYEKKYYNCICTWWNFSITLNWKQSFSCTCIFKRFFEISLKNADWDKN